MAPKGGPPILLHGVEKGPRPELGLFWIHGAADTLIGAHCDRREEGDPSWGPSSFVSPDAHPGESLQASHQPPSLPNRGHGGGLGWIAPNPPSEQL